MPSIFFKSIRRGRRRDSDGTSLALVDAGIRLLAQKDYDAISMARIAREAECSVGALYTRYSDKNAYLYRVLAQAFRSMRENAKRTLDGRPWPRASAGYLTADTAREDTAHNK